MKTIAIINQKGGVGKSTTAFTLASGLKNKGYKTLCIDMDAQGNLSYTADANDNLLTIYDLLAEDTDINQAIQHTKNFDLIASSKALSGADGFITDIGKEYKLKEILESVKNNYDYIIIDTPPALGILTVNALTACDSVIIPAQADIYSLQGIEQLSKTIQPIKKYCNDKLKIDGILLTRYSPRAILSREVAEIANDLAQNLNTRVFKSTIREAIAVKESQINKQSLFDYAPNSNVTNDYLNFINEILKGE